MSQNKARQFLAEWREMNNVHALMHIPLTSRRTSGYATEIARYFGSAPEEVVAISATDIPAFRSTVSPLLTISQQDSVNWLLFRKGWSVELEAFGNSATGTWTVSRSFLVLFEAGNLCRALEELEKSRTRT